MKSTIIYKCVLIVLISCLSTFLKEAFSTSIETSENQMEEITFRENNIQLFPTWRYKPMMRVSNIDEDPAAFSWTSSNRNIAYVNRAGNVVAVKAGNVTLTARRANSNPATLSVSVKSPVLNPKYPQEDPFLKQPADCSKERMRVLILNYLPTTDGVSIDLTETGPDLGAGPISLADMENRVKDYNVQMKFMSEERTKFRGYKNPNAEPYLGYEIVEYVNIYEPIPRFHKRKWRDQANQFESYFDMPSIADRFNWKNYVDNLDVDEIWVWAYHNDSAGGVFGSESEMSSPTTSRVSNSWTFTEETKLPVYSKTYMVYWFNYGRTPNLHNHGHQLESIFKKINRSLFLDDFATYGRCGDDHSPPNTTVDYDYLNTTKVLSDIEDWKPSGGSEKLVNVDNWGNINYNWPYGKLPGGEIREVNFYIYWMQNMPGYLNAIPHYNNGYMSNWWQFIADWDTYNHETANLFQDEIDNGADCGKPCAPSCSSCSDRIRNQGETGIDCGGPCPACPTCSDNIKNQGETDIDCGGPCDNCISNGCNVPNGSQNGAIINQYEAPQFIISPGSGNQAFVAANSTASFDAGEYIELRPGFRANLGSNFTAFIDGCNGSPKQSQTDNILMDDIALKVYPNPLNDKGFIEFDLKEAHSVNVFITDITGKKNTTLANQETKKAGKHQLTFERKNLPAGIYYCSVITDDRSYTTKLILSE